MDIQKLQALAVIQEAGSFSRAAETLGYSQAGLTYMMNSLENEIGLRLLDRSYSGVRFAVWSSVNGQDDLTWYTAKKNSSGQWTYTVPLVNHNSTGTYFIHIYSGNKLVAHTTAYVS